jgi:hypothetical protein
MPNFKFSSIHKSQFFPRFSELFNIHISNTSIENLRATICPIWYLWWRGGLHKGFWLEYLKERDRLEDQGADGRIILKWILNT